MTSSRPVSKDGRSPTKQFRKSNTQKDHSHRSTEYYLSENFSKYKKEEERKLAFRSTSKLAKRPKVEDYPLPLVE